MSSEGKAKQRAAKAMRDPAKLRQRYARSGGGTDSYEVSRKGKAMQGASANCYGKVGREQEA